MKILITGASGFMGKSLQKRLSAPETQFIALDSKSADLTKQDSLLKYNDLQYDLIFHLAAWTQAGDFCLYHQGEQWIINQQINTNTLAWWQEYQPQAKMIAFGTSVSYASEDKLSEKEYMSGLPNDKFYAYAMSKRMMYAGLISLQRQFGMRYLYLVPSTLFGPQYHVDGRQMHFIFDLIRKIIRGKEYGESVALWGDGYQRRELVFMDDFIRILLELTSTVENNIINIGAGEDYTIREFAQKICAIVGFDFNTITFDTSKYVGAKSKCLDVKKLKELIPNPELSSLDTGLKATIEWFYKDKVYDLA
ncbi:MAG: NAD-dependent epimerase/dehydratase family protein [Saprospiraceae bacterium]